MPRPVRVEFPGAVYHIMARGNNGQRIFADDLDRQTFLRTLAESVGKTGWQIHGYGNGRAPLPCVCGYSASDFRT